MNAKWIANAFNLNAILDKSAPERKTFLDRMLADKANAEKFLDKHKDYLSQERIEELIETLQVLNTKIKKIKKSLPPGMLIDPQEVLKQIGNTEFNGTEFITEFPNGRKVMFSNITEQGLKLFGIDLEKDAVEIFRNCSRQEYCKLIDGKLHSMNLYQQVAILEAIIAKNPELENKIGFYNLNSSKHIYDLLNQIDFHNQIGIRSFWTGEKCIENNLDSFHAEDLVYINQLRELNVNPFFGRYISDIRWSSSNPVNYEDLRGMILGAYIDDFPEDCP